MKGIVYAHDFGPERVDNPLESGSGSTYPEAKDRIEGQFDFMQETFEKVATEFRANLAMRDIDEPLVSTYPQSATEATDRVATLQTKYRSPDNIDRLFEPIIDNYFDSSAEIPVPTSSMPSASEFFLVR